MSYIGTGEKISREITDKEIRTYYILKKVVSDMNDYIRDLNDGSGERWDSYINEKLSI